MPPRSRGRETLPARVPGFGQRTAAVRKQVNFLLPGPLQRAPTEAMVPRSSLPFLLQSPPHKSFPVLPGEPEDSRPRFREPMPGPQTVLTAFAQPLYVPAPAAPQARGTYDWTGGRRAATQVPPLPAREQLICGLSQRWMERRATSAPVATAALPSTQRCSGLWRLGHRGRPSGRALGPCHG